MVARNLSTGTVVAAHVAVASTHAQRAVGLLGRRAIQGDEGLWIVPCRGVHTCFMRFSIDLVALDPGGLVIDRAVALQPWRLRWPRARAVGVLELAAGALDRSGTELGHRIVFETEGGLR
jgi:uncharacterized membrane protein (UPF0127 family)